MLVIDIDKHNFNWFRNKTLLNTPMCIHGTITSKMKMLYNVLSTQEMTFVFVCTKIHSWNCAVWGANTVSIQMEIKIKMMSVFDDITSNPLELNRWRRLSFSLYLFFAPFNGLRYDSKMESYHIFVSYRHFSKLFFAAASVQTLQISAILLLLFNDLLEIFFFFFRL